MENMGEIDTKSIDSVQAAISLFGAKSDQMKHKHTGSNGCDKERDLEEVVKDLASYKVQLEAKDAAYMQALLNLELQKKAIDELSVLLKTAEIDRDRYVNECSEARVQLDKLELKFNEMSDRCSETVRVREQLLAAVSELKIRQAELRSFEKELAATRQSELKDFIRIELLENSVHLEKEETVDLVRHFSELNETILMSTFAAIEAEKEMSVALSEKEAELQLTIEKVIELQKQLYKMTKQMDVMYDLESQLLAKTLHADMLELAIKQTNELQCSSEKVSSDDISDLKQPKSNFEVKDNESSDQALYVESLDMEQNQLKEVKNANEEIENFNSEVNTLTDWLEKMKLEMGEIKEKETDDQVQIENSENSLLEEPLFEDTTQDIEDPQFDDLKTEASETKDEVSTITITMEEYQSLIKNADQLSVQLEEDSCLTKSDCADELDKLKRELEAAVVRIGEFRTRAEQAVTRAEVAEKAKEAIEDQLRKWREQRQKRKAARDAMKEASTSRQFNPPMYNKNGTVFQPLGQVLNIKF